MSSLKPIRNDIEDIRLLMPPDPEQPTCQACGSHDCTERGHIDEGCLFCDACWEEMCPAGVDAFLDSLPGDGKGNLIACGGP